MSDQEHLSAEYMQQKCVGLMARCAHLSDKLGVMSRLRRHMLRMEELLLLGAGLAEQRGVAPALAAVRSDVAAKLAAKITPEGFKEQLEPYAPLSSLLPLEQTMRECHSLHQAHLRQLEAKRQEMYQQALRQAGLAGDQEGDTSDPSHRRLQSLFESLCPPSASASPSDPFAETRALRLASEHILATAPAHWGLKKRMDGMRVKQQKWDMALAELSDQLSAQRTRMERLRERREDLQKEVEELNRGPLEAQRVVMQLKQKMVNLRRSLQQAASPESVHNQAKAALEAIERERATAKELERQFREREDKMQRTLRSKNIDIEQLKLDAAAAEEAAARDEEGMLPAELMFLDDSVVPAAEAFQVGGSVTPSFTVRFSPDGSGRLLAFGRTQGALDMLGLHGSAEERQLRLLDSERERLDAPCVGDEQDAIEWSAQQLRLIRRRIDARYERLHAKLAQLDAQRQRDLEQARVDAEALQAQVDAARNALAEGNADVMHFFTDVRSLVSRLAQQHAAWSGRLAYYFGVHRDALVLLQRMGEDVEDIVH